MQTNTPLRQFHIFIHLTCKALKEICHWLTHVSSGESKIDLVDMHADAARFLPLNKLTQNNYDCLQAVLPSEISEVTTTAYKLSYRLKSVK